MSKSNSSHVIISRKDAMEIGSKHYFTGKNCKRGHVALRLVSTCQCCECQYLRVKEWRVENIERDREIHRNWLNANREHVNKMARERYAKNPQKFVEKTKRYYRQNSEAVREKRIAYHHRTYVDEDIRLVAQNRVRKWVEDNPDKALASRKVHKNRRRAREKNIVGSFTAKDVSEILQLQRSKCAYCKITLKRKYHVDHILPLSKGGTNDRRNLQILCAPCNLTKGARDPITHAQSLGFLL